MSRSLAPWTAACAVLVLAASFPTPAFAWAPPAGPGRAVAAAHAPGEILVQLSPDAHAARYDRALGASGRTGAAAVDRVLAGLAATRVSPVFSDLDPGAKRATGLDRVVVVRYAGNVDPEAAARRFAHLPDVVYAEPNARYRIALAPNDPLYPLQWAHDNSGQAIAYGGGNVGTPDTDTDTNQAWDLTTGSAALTLAIIDSGVDMGHPEFAGRVVPGWDFVNNDADPSDDNGHGTACAGIALAAGNNGQGIAGVAWGVKLMSVKAFAFDGYGDLDDVAAAIVWAADNGARVISISAGGPHTTTLSAAVSYAVNTKGCALFAATGNADVPFVDYPAYYEASLGVGALSPCNQRKSPSTCDGETWWGSNYGIGLAFLAPGTRIHTTDIRGAGGYDPGDYVTYFNGTSSATPHAAGIGALVWSQNPSLTRSALANLLRSNCDDLGSTGWDSETGHGRINAFRAVQAAGGGGGPVTLFSEGFESNAVPGTVWGAGDANATNGADYWGAQTSASGARVRTGSKSAYCAHNSNVAGQKYDHAMLADLTKTAAVNVAGHTGVTFSFWHWTKTNNASDYLALQFWNGSSWVEQQRWSGAGTGTWVQASYAISGFSTFQWRWLFVSDNSKNAEGAYIDDVLLVGTPGGSMTAGPPTVELLEERVGPGPVAMVVATSAEPDDGAPPPGILSAAPLPVRGGTTLSWALDAPAETRVEIFSVTGRRVAVLAEGSRTAGRHAIPWAGRDDAGRALAPGVYYARLSLDGVAQSSTRLVLLER